MSCSLLPLCRSRMVEASLKVLTQKDVLELGSKMQTNVLFWGDDLPPKIRLVHGIIKIKCAECTPALNTIVQTCYCVVIWTNTTQRVCSLRGRVLSGLPHRTPR